MALRHKNDRLYWRKLNPGMNRPQPLISIPDMTTFFKGITCPDNRNFVNTKEFVTRYLETDLSAPVYPELDVPFMDEEIKLGINSLINNKAAGSDELVNELYKVCIDLQPRLTVLFNKILYSGKYPRGWTCGIIIPIFKKGNPNDIKNYRGITLLSTLSKLFTKVIHSRLAKWSEQYGKNHAGQAGFRQGYSTNDNLFTIHAVLREALASKQNLYVCYVDFAKAFDHVILDNVWFKLANIGVTGKLLTVLRSMYSEVKSVVRDATGAQGYEFLCVTGVRQGESLSPFLFSMLIKDMEEYIAKHSKCKGYQWGNLCCLLFAFADDLAIVAKSPEELQAAMDSAQDYCSLWGLNINHSKTKVMCFNRAGKTLSPKFKIGGAEIESTESFCYLGLSMYLNAGLKRTIEKLANQASKATFKMKSLQRRWYQNTIDQVADYKTLIIPILTYGAEMWGHSDITKLDTTYNEYHKRLLGVKQCTPTWMWQLELGVKPLRYRTDVKLIILGWTSKCENTEQT